MSKKKQSQPPITQGAGENDRFVKKMGAIAGLLTAITAVIGVITALPRPNIIFPATPTEPGSTETLVPYARIQSLEVVYEDNSTGIIDPFGEINLNSGENVLFKATVITNLEFDALVFHWDFCTGKNTTIGQGAIQIPYQMGDDQVDCITLKIEKGGVFLDKADFFISQKQQ